MQAASKLIAALSSTDGASKNLDLFEDFAAHPVFAMQEVREQMIAFAGMVAQSQSTTDEEKQRAISLAVSEMQKQVQKYPFDAREYMQLSYAYRIAGDNDGALKALESAVQLSPKKETFFVEKGTVEWNVGDVEAARDDFNTAYALGPQFEDLAVYAAAGNIATGDQAAADKILTSAFGTTQVDSDTLVIAYYRSKNWPRLIGLLKSRTEKAETTPNIWFSLAAAYYESGDRASAIRTINAAVALFPEAADSGAAAIKQIEGQ
jgi:tetratricopeptide (TPR) repeat protein